MQQRPVQALLNKQIHVNTNLVEDDAADLAADVDARRADAEDAGLLEAILRVHRADGECRRQRWWYDDRDDVECA